MVKRMSTDADTILTNLETVESQRRRRVNRPALGACVDRVKDFQHARFARSYADLLASPRYKKAARFFLDDLYGPHDFSDRDAQFARVVPALVRLFPANVVSTVRTLSSLHALSEELDTEMGESIGDEPLDARAYQRAWQAIGRAPDRQRQIDLMMEIGVALERYTGNLLLARSLRMMRGPAKVAGLKSLQDFLESGFDAFRAMRGASEFLDTIARRESELAKKLFGSDPVDETDLGMAATQA